MADDKSVVTVSTLRRSSRGTFLRISDTTSDATPRTMAAKAPLPPWAALFVREKLISYIRTIGLYKNKAKHVIALSQKLISDFGGQV
ncbi:MAG: hypothetical protein II081_01695, partial [Prevotella sp.]|nr:hypothetical protein [Prevotella sp.]